MPRVNHFAIPTDVPDRAINFYQEVFGWQFEVGWEYDTPQGREKYWYVITGDGASAGINGVLTRREYPGQPISVGIEVPAVDAVAADQRGHGIGVSLEVYTNSDMEQKKDAVKKLEAAVLRKPGSGSIQIDPLPKTATKAVSVRLSRKWSKRSNEESVGFPNSFKRWSGRRGSNPRRPAWEAGILPLNYSRILPNQLLAESIGPRRPAGVYSVHAVYSILTYWDAKMGSTSA